MFALPLSLALLSLDVCSNVFAAFTPILENSFALSFVCCSDVLNASIFPNIVLFVTLIAVTTLFAKLLTAFAYTSDTLLGENSVTQFAVISFTFPVYGVTTDWNELIICFCDST